MAYIGWLAGLMNCLPKSNCEAGFSWSQQYKAPTSMAKCVRTLDGRVTTRAAAISTPFPSPLHRALEALGSVSGILRRVMIFIAA